MTKSLVTLEPTASAPVVPGDLRASLLLFSAGIS